MTDANLERSTFLTVEQVISQLHHRACEARAQLLESMRQHESSERLDLFLDTLDEKRKKLEETYASTMKEASATEVLDVYTQFVPDIAFEEGVPAQPIVGDIVRWILNLDREILQVYREICSGLEKKEAIAFVESLEEIIESHDRAVVEAAQYVPTM